MYNKQFLINECIELHFLLEDMIDGEIDATQHEIFKLSCELLRLENIIDNLE